MLQYSSSFLHSDHSQMKKKKNNKNKIIKKNGDKHFHLHGTVFVGDVEKM